MSFLTGAHRRQAGIKMDWPLEGARQVEYQAVLFSRRLAGAYPTCASDYMTAHRQGRISATRGMEVV